MSPSFGGLKPLCGGQFLTDHFGKMIGDPNLLSLPPCLGLQRHVAPKTDKVGAHLARFHPNFARIRIPQGQIEGKIMDTAGQIAGLFGQHVKARHFDLERKASGAMPSIGTMPRSIAVSKIACTYP